MDKKNLCRLVLFIFVVMAGAAYPVIKIIHYEFPSERTAVYRFKAGIADPYDPFRGRYVALNPLPNEAVLREKKDFEPGTEIYAVIGNDKEGLAVISDLVKKPVPGYDCLKVRFEERISSGIYDGRTPAEIYRVRLPFNRFYLNERLAPEADRAVSYATRYNKGGCVIKVRIYSDGNYAIEDLEINGKPIRKYIRSDNN